MATIEQELREALQAEATMFDEATETALSAPGPKPTGRQALLAASAAAVLVVVAIGVVGLIGRNTGSVPPVEATTANPTVATEPSSGIDAPLSIDFPVSATAPLPPGTIEIPLTPLTEVTDTESSFLSDVGPSDRIVAVGDVEGVRVFALFGVTLPEVTDEAVLCLATFSEGVTPGTQCGSGSGFLESTTVSPDMREGSAGIQGGVEDDVAYVTLTIGDTIYSQRPNAGIVYLIQPFSPGDDARWTSYTGGDVQLNGGNIDLPYLAATTTTVPSAVEAVYPDDWPDTLGRNADPIAEEGGIGMALVEIETEEGGWALAISDTGVYQGAVYLEGRGVGVGFHEGSSAGEVVVTGVAPLGTAVLEIDYGGDQLIMLDRPIPRPDVERTFFIGVGPRDASRMIGGGPAPKVETTALDVNGNVLVVSSGNALISNLALQVVRMVVDSITIETIPEVIACQAPDGTSPPPNQGQTMSATESHSTPVEALKAFLAQGIGDPPIFRSGYVEMIEPDGAITYGIGSGDHFVTLISVIPVEEGWTVDRWDASGC